MIGNRIIGVTLLVIVALALVDVSEACKKCGIPHCDCLPQHELAHHHLAPAEYQPVYYAQPEPAPPPPPPATYAYYAEPEPEPAPLPPPPPPPPANYYYCYAPPPPPPPPICKVCGGHTLHHDHLLKKLLLKKLLAKEHLLKEHLLKEHCQCY